MAQTQSYSRSEAKSTTGNITASGQSIVMAITSPEQTIWTFHVTGTYAGIAWNPEFSVDNQTTWLAGSMQPFDGGPRVQTTTGWGTGTSTQYPNVTCAVPGGATHIRLRCSAYTSGTATVRLWAGPGVLPQIEPPQHRIQAFNTTSASTVLGSTSAPTRYYCTNFSTGYNGATGDAYCSYVIGGFTQTFIWNSTSSTTESGSKIEHTEAFMVPLGPSNSMAQSGTAPSSMWTNASGFFSL